MRKWGLILALLIGLLASVVTAQDDTHKLPPLAGDYSFTQTIDGQSTSGTLTIDGTGPIYTLTVGGGPGGAAAKVSALAQGDVVISVAEGQTCSPAALIRQSDGTLFGVWIDSGAARRSLGQEYYRPQKPTTDFVGSYDFVGNYSDGTQYTGSATITKNKNGAYSLAYSFTKDEHYPDETSEALGTLQGVGLVSDKILGFSYIDVEGKSCGAFVAKFAPDGSYQSEFVSGDGRIGSASGTRKDA